MGAGKQVNRWSDGIALALLVGATAWLSLKWGKGADELAAVWISSGILTGWLLARQTRTWPIYLGVGIAADLLGQWLAGVPLAAAAFLATCHLIEVLTVAWSVRRMVPNVGDPQRWLTLGGVATASTLAGCALSGVLAAWMAEASVPSSFLRAFLGWYAAHVVGMVIFATTTLVLHVEGWRAIAPRGKRRSFVISMALIAAVGGLVFSTSYPVLFLTYPPLLLAAFRHRFPGVAAGVILLGVIGGALTAQGSGPLWGPEDLGDAGRIALLQLYLAGGCLITIPVVLGMAERDKLTSRVRENEHRYRLLADYSGDLVVRLRPDGERVYVSPASEDILGWRPAEMLGLRWSLVHPDDQGRQRVAMDEVLASGQPQTLKYRVRHRDGHYLWMEVVMRPIPKENDPAENDLILSGRDISRRVAAEEALEASRRELERLSRVDALTGVPNRRQLEERLSLALLRIERSGEALALMYLDIDHFKCINDTHGHAVGDKVIREFARRLVSCVRATDLVVRLGGDEFVILLEHITHPVMVKVVAEKIIASVREPLQLEGLALQISTSIGAAFAREVEAQEDLLVAADDALYEAKEGGRDQYRVSVLGAEAPGA
ncbi:diguanylate cyclase [Pseudomonas sp. R2.Fl]|nr:diguanylate cyclase [Pseudomonas sp. R2.Fl]